MTIRISSDIDRTAPVVVPQTPWAGLNRLLRRAASHYNSNHLLKKVLHEHCEVLHTLLWLAALLLGHCSDTSLAFTTAA